MFAEQKILELFFQNNSEEAEKMLSEMFKGELMEFKEIAEQLIDSIDEQLKERFGFNFNR